MRVWPGVRISGKVGYIDLQGRVRVFPEYDYGSDFSEGMAAVANAGSTGLLTVPANW